MDLGAGPRLTSTAVFFHAHPDDEAVFTGGTICRMAAEGHRTVVVAATTGGQGHDYSGELLTGTALVDRRADELRDAVSILGAECVMLGFTDSGVEGNAAGGFAAVDPETAADRLAKVLVELGADVLVTYDERGGYGHTEHIQAHRVGMLAAARAGVSAVFWATFDRDRLRSLMLLAAAFGVNLDDASASIAKASHPSPSPAPPRPNRPPATRRMPPPRPNRPPATRRTAPPARQTVTPVVTIRKASPDDARPLGAALARAFAEDPVMRWLLPARGARSSRLPRLFAMELRDLYLPYDEVYTTRDLEGGALWAPPDRWRTPPANLVRALPRLVWTLRARMPLAVNSVRAIERLHPQEAHWYLAVVGTDPSRQRQGVGSALLAPVLERCDRDYVPAYLESSREDNLGFYQRLGFEVTGRLDLPGGGPRIWPMWREPRP